MAWLGWGAALTLQADGTTSQSSTGAWAGAGMAGLGKSAENTEAVSSGSRATARSGLILVAQMAQLRIKFEPGHSPSLKTHLT